MWWCTVYSGVCISIKASKCSHMMWCVLFAIEYILLIMEEKWVGYLYLAWHWVVVDGCASAGQSRATHAKGGESFTYYWCMLHNINQLDSWSFSYGVKIDTHLSRSLLLCLQRCHFGWVKRTPLLNLMINLCNTAN